MNLGGGTYLNTGYNVCTFLKQLSGFDNSTYETQDSIIHSIVVADELDESATYKDISSSDSEYPIYAWYSNNTIYIWSQVDTIYMNSDSSGMFYNCQALTSLDLSKFNTINVTDMSNMFYNCQALTSLDLSKFNTINVTDMSNMFYNCSSIVTIYSDDEEFDTSKVTNSSDMFTRCSKLVGGNRTEYDSSKVDVSMAHIDVPGNPGYFTSVPPDYLKPLSECTVEEIQKIVQSGHAEDVWSVGDIYPITLNGTVSNLTFNNETYYAAIIGFSHNADLETNGYPSVTFQFGETEDGIRTAFVDDGYNSASDGFIMNRTDDDPYAWKDCYMRNTICAQFFDAMPKEWQDIIKPTIKYTDNVGGGSGSVESNISATEDKIFLLNGVEVGSSTNSNSYESNYTKIYGDYYTGGSNRIRYQHTSITDYCLWWTRSIAQSTNGPFCLITGTGGSIYNGKSYDAGFAPAFTIF